MASGRLVAATLIAMTIVAVFIGPLASITNDNTGTVGVNETVSVQTGEYVDLEGYDITGNFTAENDSGTTLTEGSDYELNQTEGTIKFLSGSTNVNDGESATAVYEYQATGSTTTTVATLVPLFAGLLILGTAAMKMRRMM